MNTSDIPSTAMTGAYRGAYPPADEPRRRLAPAAPARAPIRPAKLTRSQELKASILTAFVHSGYSALAWVGCEVRGNQVILQGSVPSYHLKQLAQVFAQRVDGVERIQNCLEVSRRLPA